MGNPKREEIRHSAALSPTWVIVGLAQLCAFLTAGCGAAKPSDTLSRAENQLRAAIEARADELAPMDLQRAREKLESSKQAIDAGRHGEARRLAEGAEVEAELAEAKADAEITRHAADRLRRSIDALRQELKRSPTKTTSKE